MHCSRNKYIVVGILMIVFLFMMTTAEAQCSICTRTAQQLGEKPAKGLNAGIMYLAFTPLLIIGFVAWKVIRKQNSKEA